MPRHVRSSWEILFFPPVGIRSGNSGSFDRAKDESDVARGRKVNSAFRAVECDQIAFTLVKTREDRGLEFPRRFAGPASPTITTRRLICDSYAPYDR